MKLIIKTKYTKNKNFLILLFASAGKMLSRYMNSPWAQAKQIKNKQFINSFSMMPLKHFLYFMHSVF